MGEFVAPLREMQRRFLSIFILKITLCGLLPILKKEMTEAFFEPFGGRFPF